MGESPGVVVAPRVLSELSGDPLPLVDVVEPYLGRVGAIALVGTVGSGKSTALLAPAERFRLRLAVHDDDADPEEIRHAAETRLVLYARTRALSLPHLAVLRLARWGMDEALEYLMARHRDACADVMGRLGADPGVGLLDGTAALWTAALDRLATGVPDVAAALGEIATGAAPGDPMLRHRVIRDLRQAHALAHDGRRDPKAWPSLHTLAAPAAIREAARLLAGSGRARRALSRICKRADDARHPMAASLLLALDPQWKPSGKPSGKLLLEKAHLSGARWARVALPGATLAGADLSNADLEGADLHGVDASLTSFRGATLRAARLTDARLFGAVLRRADLTSAALGGAVLRGADLRGARLVDASLRGAFLLRARLEGADLTGADLGASHCRALDLRGVTLDRARFTGSQMQNCRLDGMRIDGACFEDAKLGGAHLTGSVLTHAVLRDAVLASAKLADVSWEGADLRGANFDSAIFHLGSSRSGLVDSVIPSEGSRTGYYTDDYEEQHFKSPEEIRKANLRGADLRGAAVERADFYLVDLRDARYDAREGDHFRRCGAILRTKIV